jgi:hypothetical protein
MLEAIGPSETSDLTRAKPYGITFQKMSFFVVTAVKFSNLI